MIETATDDWIISMPAPSAASFVCDPDMLAEIQPNYDMVECAAPTSDPNRYTVHVPFDLTTLSLGKESSRWIKDPGITGRTKHHIHFHTTEDAEDDDLARRPRGQRGVRGVRRRRHQAEQRLLDGHRRQRVARREEAGLPGVAHGGRDHPHARGEDGRAALGPRRRVDRREEEGQHGHRRRHLDRRGPRRQRGGQEVREVHGQRGGQVDRQQVGEDPAHRGRRVLFGRRRLRRRPPTSRRSRRTA